MISMSRPDFELLVADALDSLPPDIAQYLNNVEVVVAGWPSTQQLRTSGVSGGGMLLGLYEGVPLTRRGAHYNLVLPDKITLFQNPILAVCNTPAEALQAVRRTIAHEIAHHFGFSDDDLREMGAY
jgi:predicted Zn-dependent protease with MMP-like domain